MRTPHLFRIAPLALAAGLACSGPTLAQALPHGATVINGSAAINTFSNGMQVINTPGTILHWQGFSIGHGQTVRFDQVNAQSAVLNRVTGNAHSDILGTLQSNGRVFLLNPNGIVFGAGSVVDTAGLIASTLNISNEDFLTGNYRFSCFNATVCEAGVDVLNPYNNRIVLKDGSRITTRAAGEGGQVWLIARDRVVSEKGSSVDAPTGQVMAAAAREVTVTSPSLGQMSFTLAGTAGSRVDLEGDIDVARGAAGFFADTVRLAGGVRALSDVDAAGQIVAQASSDVIVDGDARLSVSGTVGADAGAIRLMATRTVTVAASVDVAADGGVSADGIAPGGTGGLIELRGSEVVLPGMLGASHMVPIPLHAQGQGPTQRDLARDGRIDVIETGARSYAVVNGPSWSISFDYTPTSTPGGASSTTRQDEARVLSLVPGSDGRYLVITKQQIGEGQTRSVTGGAYTASATATHVYRLHVVNADGSVALTHLLASESGSNASDDTAYVPERYFTATGLAKGGWVLQSGYGELTFIAPGTLEVTSVSLGGSTGVGRVLRSGGVLVVDWDDPTRTFVYDSHGRAQSDVAAALANEPFSGHDPFLQGRGTQYDTRRQWRVTSGGLLQQIDRTTDEVLATVTPDHPNLTTTFADINGNSLFVTDSPTYGFLDGTHFTPVLQAHYYQAPSSQSDYIESVNYDGWYAGSSRSIGYVRSESTSRYDGTNAARSYTGSNAFNIVTRSVQLAPSATGIAGQVLASPLLASTPGQSNGTAGGGGGVTQPPVDPGPGTGTGTGTPGTGAGTGAPAPAPGRSIEGGLPPPAYFPTTRTPGLEVARAPITIPASTVTDARSQAEIDAELRADAERLVREYMGPQDAARFAAAKTDEERRPFIKEVAYAMTVGEEVYDATRSLGEEMRAAMFNGWGTAQLWGMDNDDEDFSTGLMKAMTEKLPAPPNEDGSPGVPRTRLQVAFDVADLEIKQAETKEEKEKIGRRVFRDMVNAAREASGKEVDPDADLVLSDGNGGTVRINDEGDMVYEKGGDAG